MDRCLRRRTFLPVVYSAGSEGVAAHSTADLSLTMLIALTTGLACWIVDGLLRGDVVIIAADSVGAALSASVLAFKLRDMRSGS